MTIRLRIRKLQYDINREAAEISALSSNKLNKYDYLPGEEVLPSNEKQIIEQTKFTYSPSRKAFEKQAKTMSKNKEVNMSKQLKITENK